MSDFTKTKIGFAAALIAVMVAVSLGTQVGAIGFTIFSLRLEVQHLYNFLVGCIGVSLYFYGIQFIKEGKMGIMQKMADTLYAIAFVAPVAYITLFIISLIADALTRVITIRFVDIIEILTSTVATIAAANQTFSLVKTITKREQRSKVKQLESEELRIFDRAKELYDTGYYDLSVVESFKAIETALRKALIKQSIIANGRSSIELVKIAAEMQIIPENHVQEVHNIRNERNKAAHNIQATPKEIARDVLSSTSRVLASLSLSEDDEQPPTGPYAIP